VGIAAPAHCIYGIISGSVSAFPPKTSGLFMQYAYKDQSRSCNMQCIAIGLLHFIQSFATVDDLSNYPDPLWNSNCIVIQLLVPYFLSISAASFIYMALADIVPGRRATGGIISLAWELPLIALGGVPLFHCSIYDALYSQRFAAGPQFIMSIGEKGEWEYA
jgi:hypothetical protein